MMDHFNATVFNGSMVSTRRGFQVTKQKHRGIAFVNASVQNGKKQKSTPKQTSSLPTQNTQLTFITNGKDENMLAPPRRRTKRSKSPSEKASGSGVATAKSLAKEPPSRPSSSYSSSSTSSGDRSTKTSCGCDSPGTTAGEEHQSLPAWATYRLPKDLRDPSKRLLFMCLAFAPSNIQGYDENGERGHGPQKTPEEYAWLVQDPTSLHCAVTLGALFDAISLGKRDTPDLLSLNSQLSSIINRRLNDKKQNGLVPDITIHAVATLAILAGYLGKHDHWHVHMSGLLRLLDMAGGQNFLEVRTINTVRKADFVGAVSAATSPYIPFARRQVPLRCPYPIMNQEQTTRDLARHLSACGIEPAVIDTLCEVEAFNSCVALSQESKGIYYIDQDIAMEHYYSLGYKLLSYPQPLREFDEVVSLSTTRTLAIKIPTDSTKPSCMAPDSCVKALESAMRILALMCTRDPAFYLPCGESILFNLLEDHLRAVLFGRRREAASDSLIDPTLPRDSTAAQRPTLIWICLAGDLLSTMNNVSARSQVDEPGRPTIYQTLLRDVLGPEACARPDLISEADLEMCRLLDLGCLQGQQWDARQAIEEMLSSRL